MSSGLLQVFVELGNLHGTMSFIESTGVACSDSISHNRVQVLSISVLLLAYSQDWTCNLQMVVSLETKGTDAYNHYAMCPAVEITIKMKTIVQKPLMIKNQTSSQKFRQLTNINLFVYRIQVFLMEKFIDRKMEKVISDFGYLNLFVFLMLSKCWNVKNIFQSFTQYNQIIYVYKQMQVQFFFYSLRDQLWFKKTNPPHQKKNLTI